MRNEFYRITLVNVIDKGKFSKMLDISTDVILSAAKNLLMGSAGL